MRLFYDHLTIDLHQVYAKIEHLEIEAKDKQELIKIVDEISHHTILDTILKHLDKAHHHIFLDKIHQSPHDSNHIKWLKNHVSDIEAKIAQTAKKLTQTLLREFSTHVHQSAR